MEMDKEERCKNCKYRIETKTRFMPPGICTNGNMQDGSTDNMDEMLIYEHDEGGSFYVGDNFGCVHFEKRVKTDKLRKIGQIYG